MSMRSNLVTIMLVLLLGACANLPFGKPEPEPSHAAAEATNVSPPDTRLEVLEVAALLAEFERVASVPPGEARHEHQAAITTFAENKSEFNRLRLALVLAAGIGGHNDALLATLLEESVSRSEPPESARHQLVTLLQKLLADRSRQQREDQRRADTRVREAQAHAADLQKKLDALLQVERKFRPTKRENPKP